MFGLFDSLFSFPSATPSYFLLLGTFVAALLAWYNGSFLYLDSKPVSLLYSSEWEQKLLQEMWGGKFPGAGIFFRESFWIECKSKDGFRLCTYRFLPPSNPPKALLFLWHGWNEHADWFAHVAKEFSDAHFACFALDLRGHGRSEGMKGFIRNFDELVDDALDYIEKVVEVYPKGLPIFLFGQSLGGMMSLHLALRRPNLFQGMVLIAPAIRADPNLYPLLQRMAKVLAFLWPTLPVVKLKPGLSNQIPAVLEASLHDPHSYRGYIRAQTGVALLESCYFLQNNLEQVQVPFLVLQGSNDKMVDPEGAKMLFEKAPVTDKTIRVLEGMWHDLIHEPQAELVIQDSIQWCSQRLATLPSFES